MPTHQRANQRRQAENDARKKSQTDRPGVVNRPAGIDAGLVQRARLDPRRLSPADVLQLQRTMGNRAVARLLEGAKSPQPAPTQPAVPEPHPGAGV